MDTVQFVDAISATPTVRLDLNDDISWGLRYEGTDLSPPELRRGMSQTLLTDGATVTAAVYDNRTLRLRLELIVSSADTAASRLQALSRELDRPTNVLRWQPGTTAPVFFRTLRSPINRITEVAGSTMLRLVDVDILAEPFAYGLRETLAPVTVPNNPASPGGCYLDIAGVRGDVETPLYLRLGGDVMGSVYDYRTVAMGIRRRGTPSQMPMVLQAEAMTTGTATALAASNDPLMSGTGPNYARITPTTSLMEQRLYATSWPAVATPDVRGRYRILARMRHSQISDVWSVQLVYGNTTNRPIYNTPVTVTQSGVVAYYDLGTIQLPVGADPVYDGYSATETPVGGTRIAVYAQRVSGTGTLDVDLLQPVPADDRYAVARVWSDSGSAAGIVDGARHMVYAVGAGGEVRMPAQPDSPVGGLPLISPGVTNRVVWLVDGGSPRDVLTSTSTLTPYYWPRYLYARPPSS